MSVGKANMYISLKKHRFPGGSHKGGFTLFELLIALFIGTILIMSGVYAIRIGLFSMEKGENWFNDSTKEKAAIDFFWQQVSALATISPPGKKEGKTLETNKTKKDEESPYFTGEKDYLLFVTPLSLKRHYGMGLVIAHYRAVLKNNGKYDLIYTESRANLSSLNKSFTEPEVKLYGEDHTVFFQDCDKLDFFYLINKDEDTGNDDSDGLIKMKDTDNKEGTNLRWKEKIGRGSPQAIKLVILRYGKEQELVVPIMVTYSFLASGQ